MKFLTNKSITGTEADVEVVAELMTKPENECENDAENAHKI